jgi:curved DNA-binding protein CbpA
MYPFYVLDVPHDVTDEQVAARYRALVRAFPPDRAPERFGEIRRAYEALADRRSRVRARLEYMEEGAPSLRQGPPPRLPPAARPRLPADELAALLRDAPGSPAERDAASGGGSPGGRAGGRR